jgi:hypothetical protein
VRVPKMVAKRSIGEVISDHKRLKSSMITVYEEAELGMRSWLLKYVH